MHMYYDAARFCDVYSRHLKFNKNSYPLHIAKWFVHIIFYQNVFVFVYMLSFESMDSSSKRQSPAISVVSLFV